MSTTPNMNMTIPDVDVTPDPTWAQQIVAALNVLDAHTHGTGSGATVTPSGLNINADLSFQGNDATMLRTVRFSNQGSAPALADDLTCVYVFGNNLYYKNQSGTAVQITSGASLAGTPGSISGLSAPAALTYESLNNRFTFTYDSSKYARIRSGDLVLAPYDGSTTYTNFITVKAATSLASSYSLTLPTGIPANTVPLALSSSGVMAIVDGGSAGTPSYNFSVDIDTGMFRPAADSIGFSTGGAERARLNTTSWLMPDGAVATPGIGFLGEVTTGIYRHTSHAISFATESAERLRVTSQGAGILDGSGSVPSLYFLSDTDTGISRSGTNTIGFISGGTDAFRMSTVLLGGAGLVGAPTYSFINDPDTGFYTPGSNTIGFVAGGGEVFRMSAALTGGVGSNSAPTYSFTSDADTGIYRSAADTLAMAAGGTNVATFTTAGFNTANSADIRVNGASKLNFTGSSASIQMQTGIGTAPAFKVSVFTGTLTGTSSANLHDFDATEVYATFGTYHPGVGSPDSWLGINPVGYGTSTGIGGIEWQAAPDAGQVWIKNSHPSSTMTYRVTVIHA